MFYIAPLAVESGRIEGNNGIIIKNNSSSSNNNKNKYNDVTVSATLV
jgi:hypothetical protein